MNKLTLQECDKLSKKAADSLKTSLFKLKFSADHLSAASYYQEAAKGYQQLKYFDKSVEVFMKAIESNKKQHDTWSEAQNYEEIARILLLDKDDFTNGLSSLKQASYSYQLAGKGLVAPRLYKELADKLIEGQKTKMAILLLQEAFNETCDQTHDELMRIMLEDVYVKLFDLYCGNEQFVLACEIAEKMVKIHIDYKDKKNKITKNLSRIVMLRIIMNEEYLCQGVIDRMYSNYDSTCGDDIEDIKTLLKCYQTLNKKQFNSTITYSFELYESNLLKKLKAAFDKRSQSLSQNNTQITVNSEVLPKIEELPNNNPNYDPFADDLK
jgi:tetratricopeptide (TPR) repeat protein